jgi:crotonobetainyl-CoA:carnitine CoA-transferase CaiB-like acyl-CoA transferase
MDDGAVDGSEPTVSPLTGVRVVELTSIVAGPYVGLLLADLGADVIKVEPPGGDRARDLGPRVSDDMAAVFLNLNRGKRSVVLDLATGEGRHQLKALTDTADAFVHNLRPDAATRCGADAETLRAGHRELVHCTIRGYGSAGPHRDLPAYDDIIQAAAGIAAQQEWVAGEPMYVATAIADKVAGLTAALAVTAALHGRASTGVGAEIELPMFESLVAFGLLEHLWGRTFVPARGEARYPRIGSPARRPFRTSDGWISVVVYTDDHWQRFFDLIGRPELARDDRFATLGTRTEHLDALYPLVEASLGTQSTEDWLERLHGAGIPAGRYARVEDLFDDPHLRTVGFFETVHHPSEGELVQYATPVVFDGQRPHVRAPAPHLGEHTAEVLREIVDGPPRAPDPST